MFVYSGSVCKDQTATSPFPLRLSNRSGCNLHRHSSGFFSAESNRVDSSLDGIYQNRAIVLCCARKPRSEVIATRHPCFHPSNRSVWIERQPLTRILFGRAGQLQRKNNNQPESSPLYRSSRMEQHRRIQISTDPSSRSVSSCNKSSASWWVYSLCSDGATTRPTCFCIDGLFCSGAPARTPSRL